MGRALLFATVVLVMTGCAGTTDLAAPRMLPDEHVKMPFAEVVARARAQAGVATEAFLVNDFG